LDGRTAAERTRRLARFSRTERALHWAHAAAFLVMLGSGLVLYLPALSEAVSNRPLVKAVHLDTAIAWGAALVLVIAFGDRKGLRRTLREIDVFDADDRRWLRGLPAAQGRFNAGQKVNGILTAAFALLFAVTGVLLWYGERDTRFRLGGTIAVHDALTIASLVLFLGHLYFAVLHPHTRHALRGITLGDVDEQWARRHHAKWATVAAAQAEMRTEATGASRVAAANHVAPASAEPNTSPDVAPK
jgi:formate dehydrogenase subunit gamma